MKRIAKLAVRIATWGGGVALTVYLIRAVDVFARAVLAGDEAVAALAWGPKLAAISGVVLVGAAAFLGLLWVVLWAFEDDGPGR